MRHADGPCIHRALSQPAAAIQPFLVLANCDLITPMGTSVASILVVDDEPDLRMLYELTLLREGHRVETAGSLAEARAHLQVCRFDVLITDMRLPDGLGMELLHDLRSQQRKERAIVMTAYGSAENAVEALRYGAFDYLTKPVDLKQFRAVVASAMEQQPSSAAPDCAAQRLPPSAVVPSCSMRLLHWIDWWAHPPSCSRSSSVSRK